MKTMSALCIALFLCAASAWADAPTQEQPQAEIATVAQAVEQDTADLSQAEATLKSDFVPFWASEDGISSEDLWTHGGEGKREVCFCSGTCTDLGNCIWGSCSGSLSCCIDCWSSGCDSNCPASIAGP
ncbi:MAG: hypothetical protein AAGN66_29925 [Acidobacteriota bacterium]